MTKPLKTWRPILEGQLASQAWEIVYEIADEVERLSNDLDDFSFGNGTAGIALFFAYLELCGPRKAYHQKASQANLQRSGANIKKNVFGLSFYGGLLGVAWVDEHLQRVMPGVRKNTNAPVDKLLLQSLDREWKNNYDLISGLVGFGVYALERLPDPVAEACLGKILDQLDKIGGGRNGQRHWFSNPIILHPERLKQYPDGYFDLGVAHGLGGIIGVLGGMIAAGREKQRAHELISGALKWLSLRQFPAGSTTFFPCFTTRAANEKYTRLAWCYGDLGLSIVLLHVAQLERRKKWQTLSTKMAAHAATKRTINKTGIADCGLCHGSAGAAHIFNRHYHATGNEKFAKAARFWYKETIAMRRIGTGVAGYSARWRGNEWKADPGFLCGASGIGLSFLAALSTTPPDWDRSMLLSCADAHN